MNSDQVKIFADRVFWDNLVDEYVKNGTLEGRTKITHTASLWDYFKYCLCLSIRNCIKRAPKSTVPGQHRFGFEKPCFCSL